MTVVLTLEVPDIKWEKEYLALIDDTIAAEGQYFYNNVPLAQSDFATFVQELEDEANGINLPPGIPPQQTYFLVKDGSTVIGEFRFRPHVDQPYEQYNGHIGCNLRPQYRGKGYATQALALMLEEARRCGLTGVQLPIAKTNVASIRVAEKNGAVPEKQITDPVTGEITICYWIDLTGNS